MSDIYDDFNTQKGFNQKHKKKEFKKKKYVKNNEKNNDIIEENESVDADNNSQLNENDEEVESTEDPVQEDVKNSAPKSKFFNDVESDESDSESEKEDDVLMKNKKKKQRKGKGKNRNKDVDSNSNINLSSPSASNINISSLPSTPSFISGGDIGFSGFDTDFNTVQSPEERINVLFENKIHIHKILRPRKANKFDIVISNLNMVDIEIGKALLKKIKIGCGIGGSIKNNKDDKDDNSDNYVISLNSNDPDRVIKFLVEKCNVNEDMIISHT